MSETPSRWSRFWSFLRRGRGSAPAAIDGLDSPVSRGSVDAVEAATDEKATNLSGAISEGREDSPRGTVRMGKQTISESPGQRGSSGGETKKPVYYGTLVGPTPSVPPPEGVKSAAVEESHSSPVPDLGDRPANGTRTADGEIRPGIALESLEAPPETVPAGPSFPTAMDVSDTGRGPVSWLSTHAKARIEQDQPSLIPPGEQEEHLNRLDYLCHRLRDMRQPLCPLNGVLTLLSLQAIEAGPRENIELQRGIRADLTTIQDQLQLRFPSAALVVGMENDKGFEELVRRVGPARAASQRFGHRYDVRCPVSPNEVASLCIRIAGVFEDWVYTIFRERGSVARQGNTHLFGLLCKTRTRLQARLQQILGGGFSQSNQEEMDEEPTPLSGCYFAATGRTKDRQAFVAGVFDKLVEEQNDVEWTRRAMATNRLLSLVGWAGLLVAAVLGCVLLGDALFGMG